MLSASRFDEACLRLALGLGALAGVPFEIDRVALAGSLGFADVSQNSMDAVSDRDFAAEYFFCSTMLGSI